MRAAAAEPNVPDMGRSARLVLPGCAHHVTQRGNHQQDVFLCDADRSLYLSLLRDSSEKAGFRILAFCLMTNHVHLVVVPERTDSLAKGLGRVHNDYARWLQIRQRRRGHLWQNRFFSCPLSDGHLVETLRYVEVNPVRAKLVSDPCDWAWSSARARITGTDRAGLIAHPDLGPSIGSDWQRVLDQGWKAATFDARLRESTRVGRPFGDESFLQDAEQQVGRSLRPKQRGRKAKPSLTVTRELGIA